MSLHLDTNAAQTLCALSSCQALLSCHAIAATTALTAKVVQWLAVVVVVVVAGELLVCDGCVWECGGVHTWTRCDDGVGDWGLHGRRR